MAIDSSKCRTLEAVHREQQPSAACASPHKRGAGGCGRGVRVPVDGGDSKSERSHRESNVTLRLLAFWGGLPLVAAVVACEKRPMEVPSPPFDEVFALAEVIVLGEEPSDSIAEVGEFFERRDGGFVIGDRLLPRVRSYREDGSLEAGFGRFGDGPWEFRRILSVAEVADGRIAVTGAQGRALTYLAPDLTPHSMLGPRTCLSAISLLIWRMWTPPDGQARLQNRVGGSLVRYCRMSGLLMRPLLAAGPYGVREIGSKSDKRAPRPSAIYWFFRSRLVDRLPLLRSCVLLPTSPRQLLCLSLLSFRRPVRRQCEPGRSPFSWSAPRLSVPSCWRAPPRPPSSACVPTSRPATDP